MMTEFSFLGGVSTKMVFQSTPDPMWLYLTQ